MKRLTERDTNGTAMAACCGENCKHNLAAYEDTGLEPEEISKIREDVEDGVLKSTARRYGISVDRLRELAQADREGRIEIIEPDVMECIKTVRKAQAMLRME